MRARRAPRQVPAAAARLRDADRAPGDVRQPARGAAAATARLKHDHFDLRARLGLGAALQRPAPLRQPACTPRPIPREHPLLRDLAPEPLAARFDARLPVAHHARPARRHQAAAHEQPPGRRRRQHLRERGAVPGAPAPAARAPRPSRAPRPPAWCAPSARCSHSAIRAGGTTLRDYVSADGAPGYFRQRLYVYERARRPAGAAARRSGS